MTSTIDSNPPVSAPPPSAEPKPSSFDRFIGVLMSPRETFESIARRPDWGVPLIAILVMSMVSGILVASRVDFNSVAREAMEMNPNMAQVPADRVETMVKFTAATMKITSYASPLLSIIILLIVAVVLLFSFRLFEGEGNFQQALSVTLYSWVPRLIKSIVGTIVLFTKQDIGIYDLQNPVMSNLGFLADPKSNPLLYGLCSSFDLFTLWSLFLMIIGFSVISKVSRGKSAAIVVGWWIVVNLFSLIGPAMQMMRR